MVDKVQKRLGSGDCMILLGVPDGRAFGDCGDCDSCSFTVTCNIFGFLPPCRQPLCCVVCVRVPFVLTPSGFWWNLHRAATKYRTKKPVLAAKCTKTMYWRLRTVAHSSRKGALASGSQCATTKLAIVSQLTSYIISWLLHMAPKQRQ